MLYKAKKFCIAAPRTVTLDGTRVAIGGDVTIQADPPAIDYIIKEATSAQYKKLYDLGYTSLIENVEEPSLEDKTIKKAKDV